MGGRIRPYHWLPALTIAALFAAPAFCAAPAHAQPSEEERVDVLVRSAALRYSQERYEDAVPLLEEAIELRPDMANLHYNLARSRERLGQWTRALDAYRRFLELEGDGQRVAEVRERIPLLERRAAQVVEGAIDGDGVGEGDADGNADGDADADGDASDADADDSGRALRGVGWGALAAGVGTLIGATIVGLRFEDEVDTARTADHATAMRAYDRAGDLGRRANVLFGVGGALALVGTVLLVVDGTRDVPDVSVGVGPGRLSLRGRF